MSPQTFHRFLELRCELRHLIWEASCFNRHGKRHGIHYVDCHGWRHHCTRIKCQPASEPQISACLMDAGLWAACRESRHVIQRRIRQRGFLSTDEENKSLCLKGREPATLIVDEHKDIICLRLSDWEKGRWGCRFHFYLSYADSTEGGFPRKVAFEIDGIWDHEHTCWTKMVRAISSYNSDDHDWFPFLNISIFDKNIHWFRDHSTLDDTYADSDNEFTAVQWRNLCRCNRRGVWSGALAFLMHLEWGYRYPINNVTDFTHRAQAQNGWHTDHLLDDMDVPTDEEDEKVEESNGEEQEPETE